MWFCYNLLISSKQSFSASAQLWAWSVSMWNKLLTLISEISFKISIVVFWIFSVSTNRLPFVSKCSLGNQKKRKRKSNSDRFGEYSEWLIDWYLECCFWSKIGHKCWTMNWCIIMQQSPENSSKVYLLKKQCLDFYCSIELNFMKFLNVNERWTDDCRAQTNS